MTVLFDFLQALSNAKYQGFDTPYIGWFDDDCYAEKLSICEFVGKGEVKFFQLFPVLALCDFIGTIAFF